MKINLICKETNAHTKTNARGSFETNLFFNLALKEDGRVWTKQILKLTSSSSVPCSSSILTVWPYWTIYRLYRVTIYEKDSTSLINCY